MFVHCQYTRINNNMHVGVFNCPKSQKVSIVKQQHPRHQSQAS
jgi:predicted RNA-binding Zn-ribbon protein involved in translation (DUF1610 family)